MRILYIWDADYPWDVRVEKICCSLQSAGHEVHIAARNLKRQPTLEVAQDIYIHRMRTWNNDRLNYALSFPAFFSPFWKKFIDSIIVENDIDLIVVRDLPLAIAAIWAGQRNTLPVVFDMAEDYVEMVREIWKKRKFQGLNLLVRNPYFARLVEKYAMKRFDHILVVVDEARSIVDRCGVKEEKVSIVSNTPSVRAFSSLEIEKPVLVSSHFSGKFVVIYTGGIQLGRGIQIVLEAIAIICVKIPHFLFVIVGDGYAVPHLKRIAREIGVEKYVLWVGWVNHQELFEYVRSCDIGLIPHYRSKHVDTTIPNKIFDYMGCSIPVITSDAPPMQRILEESGSGKTFKSGNCTDLAQKICEIYNDGKSYGVNGRNAVLDKYNWENDADRLLAALHRFV